MTNNGSPFQYDGENRIKTAGGYTYYYDGDGNRVAKVSGSAGTLYWRGPMGAPISESSLTGSTQEEYIFFGGDLVARRDVTGSVVHYYFSDQVGSHGVVVNAGGNSYDQDIDYYPFGAVANDYAPNVTQHYRFQGKERDTESGLDNFGARYNASNLGRFMTPDWAAKPTTVPYAKFGDPQTLNLYSFAENEAVNRIDPDGHNILSAVDQAVWACSAGIVAACGPEDPDKEGKDQTGSTQTATQTTTTAATTTSPAAVEAIDAVVKPLVESAIGATEKAASGVVEGALGIVGFIFASSQQAGSAKELIFEHEQKEKQEEAAPAAAAGGADKGVIPGHPFRGPSAAQEAFKHLQQFHGIAPGVASERLHQIKQRAGLGAADNVVIGRTGDIYNPHTGEHIGSLTSSH